MDWNTVDYGNGSPKAAATQAPTMIANAAPPANPTPVQAPSSSQAPKQEAEPQKPQPKSAADKSQTSQGGANNGAFGGRTQPKDNGNKDEYIGNVGIPYGSNMIKLANPKDATNYKYSNTFHNPTSDPITVIVWNKSGKDGRPQSGMGLEPNMKFNLGSQESVALAFDENSQVAFAQDCERDPAKGNLPNCTWGEVDFGDLRNGGWSGYDRSSIPNSAGNTGLLTISCEGAKTSSKESNSFTSAAQTNAGGALAPGPAHFHTTMGA